MWAMRWPDRHRRLGRRPSRGGSARHATHHSEVTMAAHKSRSTAPAERPASAARPSPFPPIAEYSFLSNCHTGALRRARRLGRLALRAAVRLAERVRQPARPRGRQLPLRAVRHQRADGAPLRCRHERRGDDVEDAARLGRRARLADDGPVRVGRRGHAAHPAAGRRRRRSHARSASPPVSAAASRWRWCASRCSTTAGLRRRGRSSTTAATPPRRVVPVRRCA